MQKKENNLMKFEIDNYLEWLEQFTEKYPNFTDSDYLNSDKEITNIDLENIKILYTLYDIIDKYAEEKNISASVQLHNKSYVIKYNDFYFKIGYIFTQPPVTFFNIHDINEKGFCYDVSFSDIQNNNKEEHSININKKLDKLAIFLNNIIGDNPELETLVSHVDEKIHRVLSKNFKK